MLSPLLSAGGHHRSCRGYLASDFISIGLAANARGQDSRRISIHAQRSRQNTRVLRVVGRRHRIIMEPDLPRAGRTAMGMPASSGSALLVVDMQNDFCLPGAVLRVDGAMRCLPLVIQAVATARRKHVPIIWVVREHAPHGLDVEKYRQALYTGGGGACLPGTSGAALVDGLSPHADDITVIKKRFSGFFGTNLDSLLRRLQVRTVVIAGVQTPNCIRATAFDALALDYNVTVLSDATAAKTTEVHEANLHDMREVAIDTPTVAGWEKTVG